MTEMSTIFETIITALVNAVSTAPLIYFVYLILLAFVVKLVFMIITLGKGG